MKKIILLLFFIQSSFLFSQELLASVQVDFSQIQTGNTQVFKTLQTSLENFINTTKWTEKNYKSFEKIVCSFTIAVNARPSNDKFETTLIVQSKRPIYNTTYFSPVLNINDTKFEFNYVEFEPLIFNERKFSGKNLTDVLSYYIYLILGSDADTFASNGGEEYFKKVKLIADNSQNQGFSGWNIIDGYRSRGSLITDFLKPQNASLRQISYIYHRHGLDMITTNDSNGKNQIITGLSQLATFQNTFQFYALDIFLNTKKQEIVDIFNGGSQQINNISNIKTLLKQISPVNTNDFWEKIKN